MIIKILSGLLTVAGVVTLVVKLSIIYERSNAERAAILYKLNDVEGMVMSVDTKSDEINVALKDIKDTQSDLVASQNALRNSYVLYLQRDNSLTKEDFLKYMEGIQFELKKKSGSNLFPIASEETQLIYESK